MKLGNILILAGVCALLAACGSMRNQPDEITRSLALRPDIANRQTWDERLPSGRFINQVPSRIVIVDEGEIARRITSPIKYLNYVRRQGVETGLYNDIPYHFYIDKQGKIYEGRMSQAQAVLPGSSMASPGDVYISFMDDFSINEPNDEEIESLVNLAAWLASSYEMKPAEAIATHRSLGRGPSPGAFFEAWYQDGNLVEAVKKRVPEKVPEPEF